MMNISARSTPADTEKKPRLTLEQQRAQDAWDCAEKARKGLGKDGFDKYVDLTKALPALIMNSGLMQVIAFLHEKSLDKKTGKPKPDDHHTWVGSHLRASLSKRFVDMPSEFDGCMEKLMGADSHRFQMITAEAFAWLRWMRQMAAARKGGG